MHNCTWDAKDLQWRDDAASCRMMEHLKLHQGSEFSEDFSGHASFHCRPHQPLHLTCLAFFLLFSFLTLSLLALAIALCPRSLQFGHLVRKSDYKQVLAACDRECSPKTRGTAVQGWKADAPTAPAATQTSTDVLIASASLSLNFVPTPLRRPGSSALYPTIKISKGRNSRKPRKN